MRTHFPTFALTAALLASSMTVAHAASAGGGMMSSPSSQAVGPAPVQGLANPSTDAVTAVPPPGAVTAVPPVGSSTAIGASSPAGPTSGIPQGIPCRTGQTAGCSAE
jgi:hypothetical protein